VQQSDVTENHNSSLTKFLRRLEGDWPPLLETALTALGIFAALLVVLWLWGLS
jgi:hypothetical protein